MSDNVKNTAANAASATATVNCPVIPNAIAATSAIMAVETRIERARYMAPKRTIALV